MRSFTSEALSHQERLLIGQKLAEFGDPRPGVGLRQDGLPDIARIEIPQGRLTLQAVDHIFEVKPFRMAKYPVTNSQFQVFIDDGGYGNNAWWKGIEKIAAAAEPRWKDANAPRETVSWYEAVAFCRWLGYRTKSTIRLPTTSIEENQAPSHLLCRQCRLTPRSFAHVSEVPYACDSAFR